MRILSIDPGYERLGIAIIEKENTGKEQLIFSECFKTLKTDPHGLRLAQISARIKEVIEEYKPENLSIEALFFNTNQKTVILVAESRGVVLAESVKAGLEVFEYSPPQIKLAVTGHGQSDKQQIMKMIPMIIKIEKEITSDDEFDAIAVGLTFFAHFRPNIKQLKN
jgi:crossover junction endodeoxyribonuclease RuvC